MILEWVVGVALFASAGVLYARKPKALDEYDRFSLVCSALPAALFEQLLGGIEPMAEKVAREARQVQAPDHRLEQALAEFLAPLVNVPVRKIPSPRQMFQEFTAAQPQRVLDALRQPLQRWSRLSADQKSAILLMSLPPDHSAQIFNILGTQAVQNITLAISTLPQIPPTVRRALISQFLNLDAPSEQPEAQLEALASRDPQLLAQMLRSL
jgi:hypothetical protein